MGITKIYFFFYLSYWLRLLLIVCGDIESNPGPGSDRRVRVLHSNIRDLHDNLDEFAVAGSDYDDLVCAEPKFSDRCHLSELHIPGFGCSQKRLRNSTLGAQGMALHVRERFRFFRQSKLECSCHVSEFRICSRTNNFYVYAFYLNPRHDGSLYDCLLDSMALVQSVDDKAVFVFVGDANAHHSEWLESVSPTDRHGSDALDFCNLPGCNQLVHCLTHTAGDRVDLVMTDVPDIVDVVMVLNSALQITALSLLCRVEHSVPEYNVRNIVFLKHRTNWDSVRSAVKA